MPGTKQGRPRVHPEGTTATERVSRSLAALAAQGGMRKTFRFTGEAMADMDVLKARSPASTETEIILSLLAQAAKQ